VFATTLAEHNANVRKFQILYFREKRLRDRDGHLKSASHGEDRDEPGYAKAALNFRVTPEGGGRRIPPDRISIQLYTPRDPIAADMSPASPSVLLGSGSKPAASSSSG